MRKNHLKPDVRIMFGCDKEAQHLQEDFRVVVVLVPRALEKIILNALRKSRFWSQSFRFSEGFARKARCAIVVKVRADEVDRVKTIVRNVYQLRPRRTLHIQPFPDIVDSHSIPPLDMTPSGCDVIVMRLETMDSLT